MCLHQSWLYLVENLDDSVITCNTQPRSLTYHRMKEPNFFKLRRKFVVSKIPTILFFIRPQNETYFRYFAVMKYVHIYYLGKNTH